MTRRSSSSSINIQWHSGDTKVIWTYDDTEVRKSYPEPPQSVIAWLDPLSVVVVEALKWPHSRIDNAVVFNADGTERLRLQSPTIPKQRNWHHGFYCAYLDGDGLVVVFATQVGDFWGRPDLNTGELSDVAPWR